MKAVRVLRLAGLLCMLCACGGEYEVSLRFDPASLQDEATHVQVAIVEGCGVAGDLVGSLRGVLRSVEYSIEGTPEAIGELASGSYGLVARAWDEDCQLVAASCRPITVEGSGDGNLSITLVRMTGEACSADQCNAGRCSGTGDGGVDASDGGPVDVLLPDVPDVPNDAFDAAPDVPLDAGPACADEGAVCEGGAGICREGRCCTGCWNDETSTCSAGSEASACGAGGAACTTCECPRDACVRGACAGRIRWELVDAGNDYVCASGAVEGADPALYCWGNNTFGQTGAEAGAPVTVPTAVSGLTGVPPSSLSLGFNSSFMVGADGHLWSWGHDSLTGDECSSAGLLGRDAACVDATPRWVGNAEDYCSVAAPNGFKSTTPVSIASRHVCAIREGGRLFCWGIDFRGQLGIGGDTFASSPTEVAETGWVRAATGGATTCALRSDFPVEGCPAADAVAKMYCWGQNETGALGTGTSSTLNRREPAEDVLGGTFWHEVHVSGDAVCARRAGGSLDGTIVCWGDNTLGQLALPAGSPDEPGPVDVSGLDVYDFLGAGARSFFGQSTDGVLLGWGSAEDNVLGTMGPNDCSGTPCARTTVPVPSTSVGTITHVAGGTNVTCVINTDHELYCFGANGRGQLGQGDQASRSGVVPVCVP